MQAATVLVCGVLPALTLVLMFAAGRDGGTFADDFHHEIYPQAEVMLDGRNPYPVARLGSDRSAELHLAAAQSRSPTRR